MKRLAIIAALLVLSTPALAADPYREGARDYYSGLCYRARPYLDGDRAARWEAGFRAAQKRDHDRVDRSHCHPSILAR